jgi:S1-C subfamily serine protease
MATGLVVLLTACTPPVRFATPAEIRAANAPSPPPAAEVAPAGAPSPSPIPGSGALDQFQAQLRQVADTVTPSVVEIDTGGSRGTVGSGIVIDAQGDIITNAHVVGAYTSFKVTASDGHTYQASLVGANPSNDLAIVKAAGPDASLRPATFGDSAQVKVGDVVLAIGSPLGQGISVSDGIVSALGRSQAENPAITLTNLIQTTAPLQPGSSGGALVDLNGHVIGITTLVAGSGPSANGPAGPTTNVGFAITSNQARTVAKQLGAVIP